MPPTEKVLSNALDYDEPNVLNAFLVWHWGIGFVLFYVLYAVFFFVFFAWLRAPLGPCIEITSTQITFETHKNERSIIGFVFRNCYHTNVTCNITLHCVSITVIKNFIWNLFYFILFIRFSVFLFFYFLWFVFAFHSCAVLFRFSCFTFR